MFIPDMKVAFWTTGKQTKKHLCEKLHLLYSELKKADENSLDLYPAVGPVIQIKCIFQFASHLSSVSTHHVLLLNI